MTDETFAASPDDAAPDREPAAFASFALASAPMTARRRLRVVIFVYLIECVAAALSVAPIHAWASRTWGSHPDGDAVLFQPGAYELIAWLTSAPRQVAFRAFALNFLVATLVVFTARTALLAALTIEGPRGRTPRTEATAALTLRAFGSIVASSAFGGLVAVAVIGVATLFGHLTKAVVEKRWGLPAGLTVELAILASSTPFLVLVHVVSDLARAGGMRSAALGARGWREGIRAFRTALSVLRAAPLAILGAFLWRGLAAGLLLGVGWLSASKLGGAGGARLAVLGVVHQLVIAGRVGLRASWLARATSRVAQATPSSRPFPATER